MRRLRHLRRSLPQKVHNALIKQIQITGNGILSIPGIIYPLFILIPIFTGIAAFSPIDYTVPV